MKIVISNSSKEPIYEQITMQIKEQIIKGVVIEGEMLPSIRKLAKELQISVITTKRAYEELEKDGFIRVIPGKGTFVAPQSKDLLREKRLKIIEDKLAEIIDESKLLDISLEEIINMLKLLY